VAIVDERGRLFGRVNIIDAVVGVVVLLLIPLAYGAYLLFRTPAVQVTGLQPSHVTQGATEVTLSGTHLRPFLHATVGGVEATYLFQNPSTVVLKLPPALPAGTHDLVINDEGQTVATLPGALTVSAVVAPLPPELIPVAALGSPDPHPEVLALGAFRGLERDSASQVSRDAAAAAGHAEPWGHVIGVLPTVINVRYLEPAAMLVTDRRYQVPAVLQLRCEIEAAQCRIGDTTLAPKVSVPVVIAGKTLQFVIDELDPVPSGWAAVTIRSTLTEPLVQLLRQHRAEDDASQRTLGNVRAIVQSVSPLYTSPDSTQTVMLALRVPVVRIADAWLYRGRPLKMGDAFTVEQSRYGIVGNVVAIDGQAIPTADH
jgi:hypothetical protein